MFNTLNYPRKSFSCTLSACSHYKTRLPERSRRSEKNVTENGKRPAASDEASDGERRGEQAAVANAIANKIALHRCKRNCEHEHICKRDCEVRLRQPRG